MFDLATRDIKFISGVGPQKAAVLNKELEIYSLHDLIYYFPYKYIDRSRIELALEFERYFDLVRWGIAEDKVANFVVGKHEVFPLPQTEIDKSNGKLQQNPKY